MEDVIEVKSIEELLDLVNHIPDGTMLEINLGEEEADDRGEGV